MVGMLTSPLLNKLLGAGMLALALVCAVLQADRLHWRKAALNYSALHAAEKAAHAGTVANYRAAAAEAARQDAANAARVKAEQAAITERTVDDYEARLADTDARYRRLLESAAAHAAASSGAGADLSFAADTACRAHAGAGCDELPAILKAAQDNTDQLVALQAWVREQSEVR